MLPYYAREYSELKIEEYYRSTGFKLNPDEKIYENLDYVNKEIYNPKT